MKKVLFLGCVICGAASASSFNQALISNAEKISELKTTCGSELRGAVQTDAITAGVLSHRFRLTESVWGQIRKSCTVTIKEDSTQVPVDGPIEYTITHVETDGA